MAGNKCVGVDLLENLLNLLRKSPSGAVFNPWWEVDEQNDIGRNAPAIRREQRRGSSLTISAKPHEVGAASQRLIPTGERRSSAS
jgi:hypothetical protein